LGGDLNDVWGSLGPKHLEPAGFKRAGALVRSFPAAVPLRPLDGVFFKGGIDEIRAGVLATRLARSASDHLPLVADFRVP
jgi:endonuclease/exonuclease/phosphatase family metal-dependent hydrolase